MSKKVLLRDSWNEGHLGLLESVQIPKNESDSKAVLARLIGPAMDFVHSTRNGRLYEENLCDKVVQSDYVKELQATSNFLGEPDHPMDWENRVDIHYPNVSHAIKELTKDKVNGCYIATIEILNTPNGRILKTLLDYGTKLGLSSRGVGTVIKRDDGTMVVDPNTYKFFTFDIVAMPGNKVARMEEEKKEEKLVNELTEQIDMMASSEDINLQATKSFLSDLNLKENATLIEKVDNLLEKTSSKINREEELNKTDEKDKSEEKTLIDKLRQDIESKDFLIDKLKKDNSDLNESSNTLKLNVSSLSKQNNHLTSQVERLREKLSESMSLNEKYLQNENEIENTNDQYRKILEKYVSLRCKQLGLNESLILKGKFKNYTYEDIEKKLLENLSNASLDRNNTSLLGNDSILKGKILNERFSAKEENYVNNISSIVEALRN